jgi:lipopolysaccharide O-acetyltransferase
MSMGVHLTCIDSITVADGVLFGSNVLVTDHNHGDYRSFGVASNPSVPPGIRPLKSYGGVSIGKNVWIGNNVVIVGPVRIGDGAIIAANSVIISNVEPGTMVAGNPAKKVKIYDEKDGVGHWTKLYD